jgi:hypothetical protein
MYDWMLYALAPFVVTGIVGVGLYAQSGGRLRARAFSLRECGGRLAAFETVFAILVLAFGWALHVGRVDASTGMMFLVVVAPLLVMGHAMLAHLAYRSAKPALHRSTRVRAKTQEA